MDLVYVVATWNRSYRWMNLIGGVVVCTIESSCLMFLSLFAESPVCSRISFTLLFPPYTDQYRFKVRHVLFEVSTIPGRYCLFYIRRHSAMMTRTATMRRTKRIRRILIFRLTVQVQFGPVFSQIQRTANRTIGSSRKRFGSGSGCETDHPNGSFFFVHKKNLTSPPAILEDRFEFAGAF